MRLIELFQILKTNKENVSVALNIPKKGDEHIVMNMYEVDRLQRYHNYIVQKVVVTDKAEVGIVIIEDNKEKCGGKIR